MLAELGNDALYRTEIVNGARRELPRIAHKIPSSGEFLHLSVEVSDSQVVHQFNAGSGWQVLDTWNRTTPPKRRFGFYLPGQRNTGGLELPLRRVTGPLSERFHVDNVR